MLCAVLVAACDPPFAAPPPTSGGTTPPDSAVTLTVRPDSADLFVDDTVVFIASPRNKQGQVLTLPVVWSSSDSDVVTVLQTGMVIAADSGVATVRAVSQGLTDSVEVRVAPVVYRSVASGALHSCAVGTNSRVYCWGSDGTGQLGVSPPVLERPAPTGIAAGADFIVLAAGDGHTCALDLNNEIHCWGANNVGQLGRGGAGSPQLPSGVASSNQYTALAAGGAHTCAVTLTSAVACWGSNAAGELGVGDTLTRLAPLIAAGGHVFVHVSAGASHTCGVTTELVALCWGANGNGQLGDSSFAEQTEADSVHVGFGFAGVFAGGQHSCGLMGSRAYCWGSNDRGESGTGLPDTVLLVPTPVAGSARFSALSLGGDFSCGLGTDSLTYCWGANDRGQLGDGTQTDHASPAVIADSVHFVALAAGGVHVCGMTAAGAIYCWGDNTSGQLGLGAGFVSPLSTTPRRVPSPP